MGTARKVTLLLIRFGEIVCGAVVLGILGAFCERVRSDGATVDGRIIYAMVVSGITIVYSLMSCALLKFQFLIFPFDFVLFIMWLVAFSLLASKTGTHSCSANWYNDYWGYYWGRLWRFGPIGTVRVTSGCSEWRTVLAFSFIAIFAYIMSGIVGIDLDAYHEYISNRRNARGRNGYDRKSSRPEHEYSQRTTEDNPNPNMAERNA